MRNILLPAVIFITISLNAQLGQVDIEDLDCGPDANGAIQYFWNIDTYIPRMDGELLHNTPIKTIELNFNIFQKNNGSGNFQDTPEDRAALIQLVDWINDRYANYAPSDPILSPSAELPYYDSRIRFSIGEPGEERIYFYQDSFLYCTTSSNEVISFLETEYPERLNQLNIFFRGSHYGESVQTENIFITNGGTGYTSSPEVDFIYSGMGGGAQATCEIDDGEKTTTGVLLE